MSFTNKENILEKKYALQLIYKFSTTIIKNQKSSWDTAILYIHIYTKPYILNEKMPRTVFKKSCKFTHQIPDLSWCCIKLRHVLIAIGWSQTMETEEIAQEVSHIYGNTTTNTADQLGKTWINQVCSKFVSHKEKKSYNHYNTLKLNFK